MKNLAKGIQMKDDFSKIPESINKLLDEAQEIFMELVNEQSTKVKDDNYLEKPKDDKKKVKEQMLYGNEESLTEKDRKQEEYQEKMLNE